MRLLCVGRHAYLSEHFCRLFGELGADCVPAVGATAALAMAASHEPHAIVCDCDLLTPAVLDEWAEDRRVSGLPLIAVSLTRRPEELPPVDVLGVGGVVYLPSLDRGQLAILLSGAHRPRGVMSPLQWRTTSAQQPLSV